MPKRPHYHPASLALAAAGIRHSEIAAFLGCTEGAISNYFRGYRKPPPSLRDAISKLGGPELADTVSDLIEAAQS